MEQKMGAEFGIKKIRLTLFGLEVLHQLEYKYVPNPKFGSKFWIQISAMKKENRYRDMH